MFRKLGLDFKRKQEPSLSLQPSPSSSCTSTVLANKLWKIAPTTTTTPGSDHYQPANFHYTHYHYHHHHHHHHHQLIYITSQLALIIIIRTKP
ncbi:hypothetical protein MJO28_011517 [Puccinia striiformis f. sp. tritici]|uniref:Uncharacterized protein n=1 Tax=Puccinia striiformis f. sp. tritici TaxID=168172 RepID=A0ACC0E3Y6_9BASI|nr:hypothetical protein MJO28_011517 [Puccinia striiformis f. sp. tritici]